VAPLTLTAVVVAGADLVLLVLSWKSRSVLPGMLAASGIVATTLAITGGLSPRSGEYATILAGIALGIGAILYALGRALWRVLEDDDDEGT
jgi:ABC-type thiamin/hydroxymethylpyrimidine transport system permease subunit